MIEMMAEPIKRSRNCKRQLSFKISEGHLFCPCRVQEAELARGEAERMASLADSESQRCLALEREMVERMEESGGSGGPLSRQALAHRDR